MPRRSRYEYNIAAAIDRLLLETTAVCKVDAERVKCLQGLSQEATIVRDTVLQYELARAAYATTRLLSSKNPKATGEFYDGSESSDSGDSDGSIGDEERAMAEYCYNTICYNAYTRITETLVMHLRAWLMELMEARFKPIDFDVPLKRWTRKEKILFRAEIREISYEIRKKEVLNKMVELNQSRTALGQTQETKLAVELIELLLQDIFLLRVIPFKDVVFPIHVKIYDWERVSKAIKGTHSPAECQEAWFTKFHPDLNRQAFSKAENRKLIYFAEMYNLHRWDVIAKRMQTSRSGFQCYVQYRRYLYKDKPVVLNLSQQPEA